MNHFFIYGYLQRGLALCGKKSKSCCVYTPATIKEKAVTAVFAKHGFYYPVEVTVETDPPLEKFPWIKPSKFLEAMAKMNDLHHLLGGVSLQNAERRLIGFWTKYRRLFPQHDLWAEVDSGRTPLSCCLPLFLHGDEGVTYRKDGLLVLSFQGVFGCGSSKSKTNPAEHYKATNEGIPLNFLKTGFQTRILICVCPKERTYKKTHGTNMHDIFVNKYNI